MQLEPHLAQVPRQLAAAAALGDERTREIAEALATAALPAVRLALLAALSELAEEITAGLLDHPGSPAVAVRLDGDELGVDIRSLAVADPPPARREDGDPNARISLRLSDTLKAEIDAAAEHDGVSVNTWLVRAAAQALRPTTFDSVPGPRSRARRDAHHVTGWING